MSDQSNTISCPRCGSEFFPVHQALQQCPACREQFFISISEETSDEDSQARLELEQRFQEQQDHLNQKQIRIVQLEKRSLYRRRTWMLVLALGMTGLAGQLVWRGIEWLGVRPSYAIAYWVLASGLVLGSLRFFARARYYGRQASQISLPDPTEPPDFSTLSDGSQIVENLNRMTCHTDQPIRPQPNDPD
ncbi:MAG: hypothetical protein KatS3mg104_0661 [Phycisphaerae bacterium]|jgi:hypothetical protein|nr:MAG: hypothetical protein KatS3mg104_0661 [Phycisphaerae bacterium]